MRRLGRFIARAVAVAAAGVLPQAAGAIPQDGLVIACGDGRYLTRSNGVSWWEVDSPITKEPTGSVYTSRRIRVIYNGEVAYDKTYDNHNGQPTTTCIGPQAHRRDDRPTPRSLWEVELSGAEHRRPTPSDARRPDPGRSATAQRLLEPGHHHAAEHRPGGPRW